MNQSLSQHVIKSCLNSPCQQGLAVSMMKRLLKPTSVVTVLTLVQPTFATTIEVNSHLDIERAQDHQCTLREAIHNANLGDETTGGDCVTGSAGTDIIKFISATEQTIVLKAPLTVSSYIRFDATPAVRLSGADKHRIFEIAPETVVEMEGLIFTHGRATEGGAILNHGNLTIIESIFLNNVAHNGGGISNHAELTIMRTHFAKNFSQNAGGSLWNPQGHMLVLNSSFFHNSATTGGGISNPGEHSDLTVANTIFSNNRAQSHGGGIYNGAGELKVINNTFIANFTHSASGGHSIWNQGVFHLKNTVIAYTAQPGLQCMNNGLIATNIQNLIEDGSCDATYLGNPELKQLPGAPQFYGLLTSSPAIDKGDNHTCLTFPVNNVDQQGQPRITQAHLNCDIGALEWRE